MTRTTWIFGSAFLAACAASCLLTVSTARLLGYGWGTRAAFVGLHGGRVLLLYHAPSFFKRGPIVAAERVAPSARDFLLPQIKKGGARWSASRSTSRCLPSAVW